MRKPIASSLVMMIARIMTPRVAPAASMLVALAFLKVLPLRLRHILIVACVLLVSVPSHADIITPAGLVPGDQFRIVFVSDSRIQALSPDIATYDALIQGDAVAAGLDTYNGQAVNWMVLGSTAAVSAVSRVPLSSVVPIYRIDGVKVADNAADLWDGSIDAPINLTASGLTPFNNPPNTYTGSNADGTVSQPFGGGDFVQYGAWPSTDSRWFTIDAVFAPNASYTYYGISEVLNVSDTDTDGDGVPNTEDDCPDSDLSATVVIDGCNSRAENDLLTDGCTISDLVNNCLEDSHNRIRTLICTIRLTEDLRSNGAISNREATGILRCTVRSLFPRQ